MVLSQKIGSFGLKLIYPFAYFGQWGKKTVLYEVNKSTIFRVRTWTSDKIIVWDIWKKKQYTDEKFKILPSDIVVDIGAHIGIFAVYAGKIANRGKVYAYEPYLENYNLLVENLKLNNLTNVQLFDVAVSDRKEEVEFFIEDGNVGGNSLYENVCSERKTKVSTITLEDIFISNKLKKIDFLKIDTEGAEYNILLNSPSKILRKIDRIVIEFHDAVPHGYNHRHLKSYLEKNDFDVRIASPFIVGELFKTGIIKANHHAS